LERFEKELFAETSPASEDAIPFSTTVNLSLRLLTATTIEHMGLGHELVLHRVCHHGGICAPALWGGGTVLVKNNGGS
jgi:hypothetical protein